MATVKKLRAFRLKQNTKENKTVYSTVIPIKLLIDETYFKINWWQLHKKGTKSQGYQRMPDENRRKQISKYLESAINPIMPTNIVVSSQAPLSFKKTEGATGELTLDHYPLWIIDGQNRVEGFRYAVEVLENSSLLDYEMPVTILSNFAVIDETEQFITLNVNQKKVRTDLAQTLRKELMIEIGDKRYSKMFGDSWDLKALTVTEMLGNKSTGDLSNIWYGRIQEPNTKKAYSHMVSQNSFVTSLRPLYKGGVFENDFSADEAFQAIKNFWFVIEGRFPDAFALPRDYVIQKTAGVFSLNDLANRLFAQLLKEKKNFDKKNIGEKIHLAFPSDKYDSNYWMNNNYLGAARAGSMKGFKSLAEEFKNNLVKNGPGDS